LKIIGRQIADGVRHDHDRHVLASEVLNLPVERLLELSTIPLKAFGAGRVARSTGPSSGSARRRLGTLKRTATKNAADVSFRTNARDKPLASFGACLGGRGDIARPAIPTDDLNMRAAPKPRDQGLALPGRTANRGPDSIPDRPRCYRSCVRGAKRRTDLPVRRAVRRSFHPGCRRASDKLGANQPCRWRLLSNQMTWSQDAKPCGALPQHRQSAAPGLPPRSS